jgi:hypothetical protein
MLLLTGCVSKPVLELYGARVAGVSPQGVQLLLTMKVNNENSFDVRIRNVRANVNLQHRYDLPYLQYNPDQWLGSDASTLVAVPMVIPWQLVGPLMTTSVGSPTVQYHMHGYADVTATRLLQVQRNDYMLDEEGAFSRFDLVIAAGRGVLGDVDPRSDAALARAYPSWLTSAMDGALASNDPATPVDGSDHCFGCQPFGYGGTTTRQEPSEATAE